MHQQGKPLIVETAENNLAVAKREWIKHAKSCGICIATTASRRRFCDTGWQIAKLGASAAEALRQAKAMAAEDEPTLF